MSAIKHFIFQPDKTNKAIQSMARVNPKGTQFQLPQCEKESLEEHLQTQTQKLEEELHLTQKKLNELEEYNHLLQEQLEQVRCMQKNTLSEVASSIAHELNQPLSAIRNYLSGCERRIINTSPHCEKEKLLEAIHRAMVQADRAAGIIGHVRGFIGQIEVERVPLDINQLIRETVDIWQVVGQKHTVHFKLKLAPLPYTSSNRLQIFQVLLNLIMNAVDSVRTKGVMDADLIIRSEQVDDYTVRVSIEDCGIGLPDDAEDIANMFKMFHNSQRRGLSAGLPISRSIIESHGGGIEAIANPTGGSILRFTLPICEQ